MIRQTFAVFLFGAWLLPAGAACAVDRDPFAAHIRPTDPLTPGQQRDSFRLPPGFEIQLFASEPDILKPMNMAFDARGRLWITESTEYPFPVPPGEKGRDNVKILADTNGDGRADEITTYADGLNIPLGIYPHRDGAIVFSIPNVWRLRDTDGDGTCDERTKLYGPMGWQRDAHGLNNAFRRGFDGWLYACHGFNNQTEVSGSDGNTVRMHSGNTYRMRLDGSRIEHFTWGQVNPFGMTMDPLGNLFTADCHSKPIYQLLRGGYYPSFGKPHDGLGFVPPMMRHDHGSTAIAGIVFYVDDTFPAEFRGNIFTGNVVTSRVNRDSLEYRGSTIVAHEEPDFVATSDPWFRPVDLQMGPDGALYVADFYNRIIGHYEVPLDHPGRDRYRGRIWRITYTGDDDQFQQKARPADLTRLPADKLIEALDDPNLTYRKLAMNELVDRLGGRALEPARSAFRQSKSERVRSHSAWVLHRLGDLQVDLLASAAADEHPAVRVQAMKILAESSEWSQSQQQLARAGLRDGDAFVQRAAADALGRHPRYENVRMLLEALAEVPQDDVLLRHGCRIALRDTLRAGDNFARLLDVELTEADSRAVAGVALAVESSESGAFLLQHLKRHAEAGRSLRSYLQHAARHVPGEEIAALTNLARTRFQQDIDFQPELLTAVYAGLQLRGAAPGEELIDWAYDVAGALFGAADCGSAGWFNLPLAALDESENPWMLQRRCSADGDRSSRFLSSLPRGEEQTGALRSGAFDIPRTLSFYAAGHNGPTDKPDIAKNLIRLRDAATHVVLAEARPPRDDVAQRIEWDLQAHAGTRGYFEIVDGHYGHAYAWLAVGRFDPAVVRLPAISPAVTAERQQAAAEIVNRLKLERLAEATRQLLVCEIADPAARRAAAEALVALQPDSRLSALALAVGDVSLAPQRRNEISRLIAGTSRQPAAEALSTVMQAAPGRLQQQLAERLAGDRAGALALLQLVADGAASARLLLRPSVQSKLDLLGRSGLHERIAKLTSGLPPQTSRLQKLIEERIAKYRATPRSADAGAAVFRKHCQACHQIDGQGSVVGPQLDGIGNRGLERLVEDVIDPNRNVDPAFYTTTLVLLDGKVNAGLLRREDGNLFVLVDSEGKEFTVPKEEVEERVASKLSLMPANVDEVVAEQDFYSLIAYLLTRQTEPPTAESANTRPAE